MRKQKKVEGRRPDSIKGTLLVLDDLCFIVCDLDECSIIYFL